ncbi:ABC transporter substrate-binding protein [Shewanella sp. GXUN23E]|uniref:ABC transporter substrate-binding protein n=1 Tax=Shewanella sp. GXUN23E TaxID=3422498 RepID=UPI003D7E09F5
MMRMFALLLLMLAGCSPSSAPTVRVAINPWPGYELLYLAEQRGYFDKLGLDLDLIEVATLADAQRAYLSNRVDGFTSTLIEVVQVGALGGKPAKVILAADYSNGSDVIIASREYDSLAALKGKRIGCEVSSLGLYVLARALAAHQLTLGDVIIVNVEQGSGFESMEKGQIQAMVTYPPYMLEFLENHNYRPVFTSAEIQYEILDVLSLSAEVTQAIPGLQQKIWRGWQMALDDYRQHPAEAIALMAARERVTAAEFTDAMAGIEMLDLTKQQLLFSRQNPLLKDAVLNVCRVLRDSEVMTEDCQQLAQALPLWIDSDE